MKWESMKKKALNIIPDRSRVLAKGEIYSIAVAVLNKGGGKKDIIQEIENLLDEMEKVIYNWDIRKFRELILLCREHNIYLIPQNHHINSYIADYDDSGNWVIINTIQKNKCE